MVDSYQNTCWCRGHRGLYQAWGLY